MIRGILILICLMLVACEEDSYCSADSKSAALAKSISMENMQSLYESVRSFAISHKPGVYSETSGAPVPAEFSEFGELKLSIKSQRLAYMHIETCSLDHKVSIVFTFPEEGDGEAKLQWGGDPKTWGSSVLWPKA